MLENQIRSDHLEWLHRGKFVGGPSESKTSPLGLLDQPSSFALKRSSLAVTVLERWWRKRQLMIEHQSDLSLCRVPHRSQCLPQKSPLLRSPHEVMVDGISTIKSWATSLRSCVAAAQAKETKRCVEGRFGRKSRRQSPHLRAPQSQSELR